MIIQKKVFVGGDRGGEEYLVSENEKYAILIRLTEKDLDIDNAGTVYILYGNDDICTIELSKYLLNHVDDLVKKTRKRKHFFIVFKVRELAGESSLDVQSFKDLTKDVFAQTEKRA